MRAYRTWLAAATFGWLIVVDVAYAGLDHVVTFDDSGIWNRNVQRGVECAVLATEVTGAFWLGGDDPLGKTFWFQGSGHYSFPSGEVTFVTSAVTPFIFEYGHDHPAVYALTLLPVYDAIARVKTQGHWQTDVLAATALGTLTGYLAHRRDNPFILGVLPHGITVGVHKRF